MFEKVTIEIQTNKSLLEAWNCFTSSECIIKWNFASKDWRCPKAVNNFIENGFFNYRMESINGKHGFDFIGKYTKILLHQEINYELADNRSVKIEFSSIKNTTIVRETFDAEKENSIELQKNGWQSILNQFKSILESNEYNYHLTSPNDFFETYKNTVLNKDKHILKLIYHDNISMFDVWNDYVISGKEQISKQIDDWFDSLVNEKVKVSFSNIETFTDNTYAFSNCFVMFQAISKDGIELRHIKERMTICFIKENNHWLVLNQHTSVPINMETGLGVFE